MTRGEDESGSMSGTEPVGKRRGVGATVVGWLVLVAVALVLSALFLGERPAVHRTKAVGHAKHISLALLEFEEQFGRYPDGETAVSVKKATGTPLDLRVGTSNGCFRQLIAMGLETEEIFFAKTPYTRAPDGDLRPGRALAAGEVGFAYVMTTPSTEGPRGLHSDSNPGCPILVTPLFQARDDWTFDPEPFAGKAVVLRVNHMAEVLPIRETDRRAQSGRGTVLGETGENTVWGTSQTPLLRPPEPR